VARELGVRLAPGGSNRPGARHYTPSVAAYEWYLRGIDRSQTRGSGGRPQAREYLRRAIAADSSFAAAYAALAFAYMDEAGEAPGDQIESFARAEQMALKAVALDSALPAAHAALGFARLAHWDWAGVEAELERAIALDPRSPQALFALGPLYLWTGRPAAQLAVARTYVEIDPVSPQAISRLAFALAVNGRCDEAIELLRPLKALSPPERVAGIIGGQCYAALRRWPEAIAEFRWAQARGTERPARGAPSFLAYALARAGQRDEAQRILADLLSGRKYSHGAFGIATVYTGLGDYDQAFAWMERAVEERSVRPWLMGPIFEDLRRDPRFARVRRLLNLPRGAGTDSEAVAQR